MCLEAGDEMGRQSEATLPQTALFLQWTWKATALPALLGLTDQHKAGGVFPGIAVKYQEPHSSTCVCGADE